MNAVALPAGFRPYAWAPASAAIAARHGLGLEQILRFDQNTPPVPGVPQVPLAESFARLNDYPDGTYAELKEAAAAYCGVEADQIVVGAGADELIAVCARTFLAPGRSAAIEAPTYGLYRIATELERADVQSEPDGAALIWVCNPNNPTGELRDPAEIAAIALAHPEAAVVVDEAYFEYAGATCVPLIAEHRESDRAANAVEGVRPRRAPRRLGGRDLRGRGRARVAPTARQHRCACRAHRRRCSARAAARRRGDARRAGAGAAGTRRGGLRLPAGPRQLRLRAR